MFLSGGGLGRGWGLTQQHGQALAVKSRCVLGHSWNRHEGPLSRPCVRIPGKMLGRC